MIEGKMNKNYRFAKTTTNSFFGHFLYETLISKDHFVCKAKKLIDWNHFTAICMQWYQGKGETGRPPYEPSMMLKRNCCKIYNREN